MSGSESDCEAHSGRDSSSDHSNNSHGSLALGTRPQGEPTNIHLLTARPLLCGLCLLCVWPLRDSLTFFVLPLQIWRRCSSTWPSCKLCLDSSTAQRTASTTLIGLKVSHVLMPVALPASYRLGASWDFLSDAAAGAFGRAS